MERKLIKLIKSARQAAVPLIGIETADQQQVVERIAGDVNGDKPLVCWDAVRGFRALNETGNKALRALGDDLQASPNPMEAVAMMLKLPEFTMVFAYNFQRFIDDPVVVQGVLNAREEFKADNRTFIMLAPQLVLPSELVSDVVVLDDPLPHDEELGVVFDRLLKDAELPKPSEKIRNGAIDAARGMSTFGAEQIFAMSLTSDGIDLDDCWERKKAAVNQTQGLTITRNGPERFEKLGGLAQSVKFANRACKKARVVVFLDEIEKMIAGSHSDSSGVSQDYLGALLRWMEDNKLTGMILVGPPGSGKTAFARATGNSMGIPTIEMDLGAMKGKHVGESEATIRESIRVINGVGGKDIYVIATCNKLEVLPPELRRRFHDGIWYFDLPTGEEKADIWPIHRAGYGIDPKDEQPEDTMWTGAEIRNCCEKASRLESTLKEASEFIVPVAVSDPGAVEQLKNSAQGSWLSASYPGPYKLDMTITTKRKISKHLN